jgi:hypothetical protein
MNVDLPRLSRRMAHSSLVRSLPPFVLLASLAAWPLACGGKTDEVAPTTDTGVDAPVDSGAIVDTTTADVPTLDAPVLDAPTPGDSLRPPPRPTVAGADGPTQWFVVNTVKLGITDATGTPRSTAWKAYGYDLDERTTTADDSKTSRNSCMRVAGSPTAVLTDGDHGIDNNFGAHVMQTLKSLKSDIEDSANISIADGQGTLLLRLDNAIGPDNASVPGALYATAASGPPKFDGTDVLPVSSTSVDGALGKPLYVFPKGYMAGGVWVSGELGTDRVTVPLVFAGAPFTLQFDGVITVRVADGSGGIIAGSTTTAAFVDTLTPWAKSFGICPGNATFDAIVETITESADLVAGAPDFQDTSKTCDSMSIGIGFTMVKAAPPTTVVTPPPPGDLCP